MKINTDAAIDNIAGGAATGVVAREHGGQVVVARTTKIPQMTDSYAAELLAVRDATALAVEKGWQKVVIETDCQTICEEWRTGGFRSVGGQVLREISFLLADLQGSDIIYTRRDANEAAHWCAKYGLSSDSSVGVLDVFPVPLIAIVQSDVNRQKDE